MNPIDSIFFDLGDTLGVPILSIDRQLERGRSADYDPQSVMHYFCGDRGTRELRISGLDSIGAQQVYGPPLNAVEFIS